jgi:oligoribonuclease
MLVWLDLETTGLDPSKEEVLEVAAIVTDDALNEVARFQRVIYSPVADQIVDHAVTITVRRRLMVEAGKDEKYILNETRKYLKDYFINVDPYVVYMHLDNGLWEAVRHGEALATVDADLAAFIQQHAPDQPQLAGSTISFDRGFLAAHLPKTLGSLHYRNVDVSSFNEVARRFWKPTYDARPRAEKTAHRGMADIELSIAGLKHYLASLAPVAKSEAA